MTAPVYQFPTNAELTQINQDLLPVLTAADPIFDYFPVVPHNYDQVMWDQLDNFVGLQQARGIGGKPRFVKRIGQKRYKAEPGYYGDYVAIDEVELTRRAAIGTWGQPVDIADLVAQGQTELLTRRFMRMRQVLWTLVTTGAYAVALPEGGTMVSDTFPLQTSTGSNWATAASATPLADLRAAKLKHLGHSVRFDASAKAFANQITINQLLANTNAADVGGKRTGGFGTYNVLPQYNELFTQDDSPNLVAFDDFYLDDSGAAVRFIPTGTVVIFGRRTDGARIGEFQMTRNASLAGPGPYTAVVDNAAPGHPDPYPREIKVIDAMNGGPTVEFPSAIIILSVHA